ncbi:MAG TPA: DNA-formamidopyrimidine glycosylase family protein [Myxococcaceae bacterium]|nr:DNA-formamidopyrimidine glycosylase family protein [Myxococcaceae bacterium]
MPELPEVEIARRTLERWLGDAEVVSARADRTRVFRAGGRGTFGRLRGRLARADRHGKVLLVSLDSGQGFLSHLGMTGKWVRRPAGEAVPYSRARLMLGDGTVVHYRDPASSDASSRTRPRPCRASPWSARSGRTRCSRPCPGGSSGMRSGRRVRPSRLP